MLVLINFPMIVTLNWLKQYVDFDWSPEQLAERRTMLGLEVESRLAATEWHQRVAHSANCGLTVLCETSSVGAAENTRAYTQYLSPRWGVNTFAYVPTVCTVGYYLSLLRS